MKMGKHKSLGEKEKLESRRRQPFCKHPSLIQFMKMAKEKGEKINKNTENF